MTRSALQIEVYLEIGRHRTFACAVQWPGWCRSGRDEAAALLALYASAPRYAALLSPSGLEFHPPDAAAEFAVVDRLTGNSTTDFGAPDIAPSCDALPLDAKALRRCESLLQAYWRAFDGAVQASAGKNLRKGPRGGGRDTDAIIQHVLNVERSYLARVGWKLLPPDEGDLSAALRQSHQAVLHALAAATRDELSTQGPRGGVLWAPRYFVRRMAWHVLDHAWEIEDRAM